MRDFSERVKSLLLRAENLTDPEAARRTVEIGCGDAALIVARAEQLVSECHTDYIAECTFWGAMPTHEAEDIQRYIVDPECLSRELRIATSKNLPTKQSLKVALMVIERMFGSVYIPAMG